MPRTARLRWFALVLLLTGCDGCGHANDSGDTTPEIGGSESSSLGTIEGVVRLEADSAAPTYAENPMVPPAGRPVPPESCTPPQQTDRAPLQPGAERGLNGVLVALHDFETVPPSEPVTREMTITDCRLSPRLLVATRGDTLRITNETDYPFLPDFGSGLMQVLLHDASREMELGQGGVRTLQCGFAAPCGRAEIVTMYHPFHTVTDEVGHFRITNVPVGEEIRVSAWHPLVREASERVTLSAGETRTIELVVAPAPMTIPVEPDPTDEGPAEDNPDTLF